MCNIIHATTPPSLPSFQGDEFGAVLAKFALLVMSLLTNFTATMVLAVLLKVFPTSMSLTLHTQLTPSSSITLCFVHAFVYISV